MKEQENVKYNGLNRKVKFKKRGLSILYKIVFGRAMVLFALVVFQLCLLGWLLFSVGIQSKIGLSILQILAVFVVIYIVNSDENPAFKLAWMIPVCAVPVVGTFLFLFIQISPGHMGLKYGIKRRIDETDEYTHTEPEVCDAMAEDPGDISDMSYFIENVNHLPTYANTDVCYFHIGEEKYKDLLIELEKAEHFIFLEYFIIAKGYMWDHVLDILKRKAAEGVEVRVMYDGTCTIVNLPYDYGRKLAKFGIKAKAFSPIRPLLSSHQNNRDHRKILVIDGKVAYTGGINLADEYINEVALYGHWKDAAIRLKGDAVKSFTLMFLQMWNLSEKGEEKYEKYLLENKHPIVDKSKGFVIPYNDDPTNREDIAQRVYMDILNKAKTYVHIMTPYLILDNEIVVALSFAAQRGVDVKIMLPHVPDKKIVFYIARTYYKKLMQAGVQIYEYTPGFLHSKLFVSDDEKAVVGSINLDFRSLYEHFECAAYLYKNPVVGDIEKDFQETIQKCQQITPETYKKIPLPTRVLGHVFRVFGPLM